LPLVDLLVDTRAELMELAVASGLKVLHTMLEADRTTICGPRYLHQIERTASRSGTVASEVVLGGRKVQIRRPRVRAAGAEVVLPTFQAFADTDPLNRRVVEQMLIGVATRQYGRSLEPTGAEVRVRGTSKSAVSRRFVVKTAAQLDAWRSTALEAIDLVALLIDGLHIGEHCIVAALGIDKTGAKHALGVWDGSTENAAVCQSLLADLQSRGLRTDRSLLVILDGSKALHKAVTQMFGAAALIHRCQVHKLRNIMEHLPDGQRAWVRAIVARAYTQTDVAAARRSLLDLARRLEDRYPSAAASVREGLEETLTVLTLALSDRLRQSLATRGCPVHC
jgi:transposase-like protein